MCDPRRVEVTATRQVQQAWERAVEQAAEYVGTLTGEARIRQSLDASLGGPAMMALQTVLVNGFPGWNENEDGNYRYDVEGGYVIYHPDDRTLEIVATLSEQLRAEGVAHDRLRGTYAGRVEATGEGRYYHDGWGGRTRERALEEARRRAEGALDQSVQDQLQREADRAQQEREISLQAEAQQAAQQNWAQQAQQRSAELSQRAAAELNEVGVRARQAFHQLLAHAYSDALQGLARRRGVAADDIRTHNTDEYLEIEFMLPD